MSANVCPSCNTPYLPGATFCDNCGMDLRSVGGEAAASAAPIPTVSGVHCPNCGTDNVPGAAFCENCGMQLPVAAPRQPSNLPTPSAPSGPPISVAGGALCTACGFVNVPGASFCEQCGTPISKAVPTPPPEAEVPAPIAPAIVAPTPIPPQSVGFVYGRLVILGSNVSLSIPQGKTEVTIGREDPVSGIFPDINLDPYGGHDAGVGRQHASLVINADLVCIIDHNSVNGTFLNKQKVPADQPQPLKDGDELRFGRMVLNYFTT